MFIRTKPYGKHGKKKIQICETIRNGDKVKQIIVRHVGVSDNDEKLSELLKLANRIKFEIENERTPSFFSFEELETLKSQNTEITKIDVAEINESPSESNDDLVNLKNLFEEKRVVEGFHDIFGKLFREMSFHKYLSKRYSNILLDIILARIAEPSSKRQAQKILYTDFNKKHSLDSIYAMMDKILIHKESIEREIFFATQSFVQQKINVLFFDVTTLYFETNNCDELKSFGYSKDCKFNTTQVVLALATDDNGLPIGYKLFPGKTAEVSTLINCINEWKKKFIIGEICLVADRAMMCEKNLIALEELGIKYVIAAKLRKLPKEIQNSILSNSGEDFLFENEKIKKQELSLDNRRLIITYSSTRAKKDQKEREQALERLKKKLAKSFNLKNLTNKGCSKFLKIEGEGKLRINEEKIKEDALWDGLHGIITNDSGNAEELLKIYRRLWIIEESFRIQKNNLEFRPIYHFKPSRIEAHILICYMAFSMVRHLEYRTELQQIKLSILQIQEELWKNQASILKDRKTGKIYRFPSKTYGENIYLTMGVVRDKSIRELDCSAHQKT